MPLAAYLAACDAFTKKYCTVSIEKARKRQVLNLAVFWKHLTTNLRPQWPVSNDPNSLQPLEETGR